MKTKTNTKGLYITALFFASFLVSPITLGTGRISHIAVKPFVARFSGIVRQYRGPADSILIQLSRDVAAESGEKNFVYNRYHVYPRGDGSFSFDLPTSQEPGRMDFFMYQYDSSKNKPSSAISNNFGYIVEPSDDIFMDVVFADSSDYPIIKFSGKGADKYNCIDEISREVNKTRQIFYNKLHAIFKSKNYQELATKDYVDYYVDVYNSGLKVLNAYRRGISEDAYDIIKADIYGYAFSCLTLDYQYFFDRGEIPLQIRKAFPDFYKSLNIPILNLNDVHTNNNYAISRFYKSFIIQDQITRILFYNKATYFSFPILFKTIFNMPFKGLLKDKLLAECLLDPQIMQRALLDQKGYDSCINLALSVITTSYMIKPISSQKATMRGTTAFNFSLPDSSGKIVHLSDFSGKVVLQDTWFTGCGGCIFFHQGFHRDVYPKYKNNPNFVVVSINSDKRRQSWIKSMETDKYTSPDYVNLYTNGMGDSHPLNTYYNNNVAPFLLIIDRNGKIYSRLYANNPKEIERDIDEALSQK